MPNPTAATGALRALVAEDLDAVVAIDALHEGRSRRAYIARRLHSARREPALHAQLGATDDRGLAGFILARVLEGEFGRRDTGLRLELVGVRPDARGHGVGQQLFEALLAWARRHGVAEVRTAAAWHNTRMLGWLDALGFELAPLQVVDCAVDAHRDDATGEREIAPEEGHGPGHEIDFGTREGNDFERRERGRADVRAMTSADLREIVRIDRAITGRDRAGYIERRLRETLDDSAIRVSLTGRIDGAIVGYLMARADLGDFGRTEPVAVIDTLGVDPEYARRGVGTALAEQLFANLGALRVERVETVVPYRAPALAGYFAALGFEPSQRLAFKRAVAG